MDTKALVHGLPPPSPERSRLWNKLSAFTGLAVASSSKSQSTASFKHVSDAASFKAGDKDCIDRLSDFQIEELQIAFRAYDTNGGGSIDASELKDLLHSVGNMATDDEVEEMIRIADADGSGEIDFYECVRCAHG